MQIRSADDDDHAAIDALLKRAFEGPLEAQIATALRAADADTLELVGDNHGVVVGEVMFSPLSAQLTSGETLYGIALGPVAVTPEHQGRGIGSELIEAGLNWMAPLGPAFCGLLGDPAYYERFGFRPASEWGWRWEKDTDGQYAPYFQIRPFSKTRPEWGPAELSYHAAFDLAD